MLPKPKPDSYENLVCKVTPNARRSEFLGWSVDEKNRPVLLLKLAAPAVEGRANAELIRFVAELLGCAKRDVSLLRGETGRTKAVSVPTSLAARLRGEA